MSRINSTFNELAKKRKTALITFTMGGDPDLKTSLDILFEITAAGADIIEIGIPFSDPMADGPTIQEAGQRALKAGASLKKILELVSSFRKKNKTTPVILMGYYNPIMKYGTEKFVSAAAKEGVDGLLVVDLPPEEESELTKYLKNSSVDFIRLIAPTTSKARLKTITKNSSGFLYYVSIAGITGTKSANVSAVKKSLAEIRKISKLPIAVGFGIKTGAEVKEFGKISEAVVVGSALIKIISQNLDKNGKAKKELKRNVGDFVKSLRTGHKEINATEN